MNLIRACFLMLAVLVPTSWTIARAEDAPKDGDKPAETKKKPPSSTQSGGPG